MHAIVVGHLVELQVPIGSDGDWIWTGANGTFTVPAGSPDPFTATGLVIPAFGTIGIRLTIDVSDQGANLSPSFQGTAFADVEVKGTAWGWAEMPMVDDGTSGDTTALDGVHTFLLEANLGEHDGLLWDGDEVAFVYVLDGVEYKEAGVASVEGIAAWSDYPSPGACGDGTADCVPEEIVISAGNTAIVIRDE